MNRKPLSAAWLSIERGAEVPKRVLIAITLGSLSLALLINALM